ncbi:copper amine oxidase N-terminal domain-containing protein [Desulfotomaculum copahuensis]|uniref:Copper amine oxidase-like N-terminal domain-containing protein n=1 Tax=Desulfotomaculum copahuensis TaxID=1838280 RepID=A0A1B7LKL0_9FIRM|nr:copper amine oxidase N-terminal domain-containing protein [Desulfotomaculum copahuensis]OAT87073.1 hypothetical protein A6M21_01925 [Desulfotomaculum copahuensis]
MARKMFVLLLALSLLVLPLAAYADDSGGTPDGGAAQINPLPPVPADQGITGDVYGQSSADQSVTEDTYGQPPDVQAQIAQLQQEFANAVNNNQMLKAAQILQKLQQLKRRGSYDSRLDSLKQALINDVQNGKYGAALAVIKQILRIEHPAWAYRYLGMLYHKLNQDNRPRIFANGQEVQSDVNPVVRNGRTLIPLRAVANAIGVGNSAISWNQHNNTVTINNHNTIINLPVNSPTVTVNGRAQNIDVPAQMYNNRVMVPLRFISQAFGKPVNWYPEGQMATVGD